MLDVHPPHAPTHTWRDFLLHIATIVVGLLIAVGLEQTVEAIHHHHQRQELEQHLREDGELNRGWANQDMKSVQTIMDWAQSQAALVQHAGPSGPLTLRSLPPGPVNTPNFGVWLAARANGQDSLLSTWQQNWQSDLNRVVEQTFISDLSFVSHLYTALGGLNQLLLGQAVQQAAGTLDITSFNASQRARIAEQLFAVAEAARQCEGSLLNYAIANEFLLETPEQPSSPAQTQEKLDSIERRLSALHPGIDYTFTTH